MIQSKFQQNEAQSARAESTRKGVNQLSQDVTQTQQQRPEPLNTRYINSTRGTPSNVFCIRHHYRFVNSFRCLGEVSRNVAGMLFHCLLPFWQPQQGSAQHTGKTIVDRYTTVWWQHWHSSIIMVHYRSVNSFRVGLLEAWGLPDRCQGWHIWNKRQFLIDIRPKEKKNI